MENKIYCWHSSFNNSFNLETFGSKFDQDSFINNVYNRLNGQLGIKGYTLFIVDFFRGNARMYFAIDKKLYEMTNLMAYDYHDMKVIDVDTGREMYDRKLLEVRDYVSCVLIGRNVGNICSRIQIGKSLSFLEIKFDDNIISGYRIQSILKSLFEEQYTDFSI